MPFDSGVTEYIKATATVEVYFPVDSKGNAFICCENCEFFRTASKSCALNGRVVAFPSKYVGAFCPLEKVE